MTLALKEWSAAIHALLDSRQTVLLRKGGIHEKRFALDSDSAQGQQFLLFPTVAHSHAERVRPEHTDLLGAAEKDSTDDQVVIRAAAKFVAAVEVNQPDRIDEIADLHIWTPASVRADRLDFRPRHRLTVLVVAATALAEAITLPRLPAYAGCRSWVDLDAPVDDTDPRLAPVVDAATLADVAERVRRSVG